jgi:hypothetical protein
LSSRPRISLAALSAGHKSRAQRIGLLFFEALGETITSGNDGV